MWNKYSENKPKEYKQYLVFENGKIPGSEEEYKVIDIAFYNVQKSQFKYDAISDYTVQNVTHWMELPKFP